MIDRILVVFVYWATADVDRRRGVTKREVKRMGKKESPGPCVRMELLSADESSSSELPDAAPQSQRRHLVVAVFTATGSARQASPSGKAPDHLQLKRGVPSQLMMRLRLLQRSKNIPSTSTLQT